MDGYDSRSESPNDDELEPQPISWQSYDTQSIPSIKLNPVLQSRLSFCLVERAVWDSPQMNILEKLTRGRYWDTCAQGCRRSGEYMSWDDKQVQSICGIEVLAVVDREEAVGDCKQRNRPITEFTTVLLGATWILTNMSLSVRVNPCRVGVRKYISERRRLCPYPRFSHD